MSGLVLAIFLGTMVGILAPAVNEVQSTPSAGALSNYLIGQVGLSPSAGQQLIRGIDAIPGATVYPLYGTATASVPAGGTTGHPGSGPGSAGKGSGSPAGNGARTAAPPSRKQVQYFNNQVAMSCAGLRAIGALGQCAPGLTAIQTTDASLFDDNPKYQTQPIASASDPAYTGDLTTLPLQAVLVRVGSPATLERVRTYLAVLTAPQTGAGYGSSPTPPRTFGETLQIRTARASLAEKIVYAAVALTLIVAGCSLAVTVGGGLVDRKRPFTLLRVSGTSVGVLTRVVMLEGAGPAGSGHRAGGRHRLRDVDPGVHAARPGRYGAPAARPGRLHDHGHRLGDRLRRDLGDTATAAQDDGTVDGPLRVALVHVVTGSPSSGDDLQPGLRVPDGAEPAHQERAVRLSRACGEAAAVVKEA